MGPYLGVHGAPLIWQNQKYCKFHPNQAKMPYQTRAPARAAFFCGPKPVCGGPCGQPSAWMPPTVSQDSTQSLWDPTLGSLGHPGSAKIKKNRKFRPFRGPRKKHKSKSPQKAQKRKKIEIPPKGGRFSENFHFGPYGQSTQANR